MNKKLAIIGADMNQMPLVEKAKEMGIETHCFSWDKGHSSSGKDYADYYYPISILEKEQILEVCKEIKIDGITSMSNVYAIPTVAFVAENMELTGNKYSDAVHSINKEKERQVFLKN